MASRTLTTDTGKMVMIVLGAISIVFGAFYVFGGANDETATLPAVTTTMPAPQQ